MYLFKNICQLFIDPLMELREKLEGIEDKCFEPYVEHLLSDIVMITLLAVMVRANKWSEIAQGGVFHSRDKLDGCY
jgi:hypothetical protein